MMTYPPGSKVPVAGIYWCSVCKFPASFAKDQDFPHCKNKCGRGRWELVQAEEARESQPG